MQNQQERKLATIQRIEEIKDIPDADRIQAYRIGGWWVVDSKDKYEVNQLVVFVEVDSWVPAVIAPFLSKGKEPREFNGIKGERLRTVKLKKQISQGLLLDMNLFYDVFIDSPFDEGQEICEIVFEGSDVTDILGIVKWESAEEKIIPANAKGSFPAFIPKTDQTRVQNIRRQYEEWVAKQEQFEATEKLDGSSMTVFVIEDEDGVCSRNLELKNEGADNGTFWDTALKLNLHAKIRSTGRNLALQGELCGPGIQGNSYGLKDYDYFVYDIFDIDKQEYLLPEERQEFCCIYNITHVPIFYGWCNLPATQEEVIKSADGNSLLNSQVKREGLVFKNLSGHESFKSISAEWLLKKG